MVETDDPRFAQYSQLTKHWNPWGRWSYSYQVTGGEFLDDSMQPLQDDALVDEGRVVYLRLSSSVQPGGGIVA